MKTPTLKIVATARAEMSADLALRASWAQRLHDPLFTTWRRWYAAVPPYARHAIFGEFMPAAVQARAANRAGTAHSSDVIASAAKYATDFGRKKNIDASQNVPSWFAFTASPGYATHNRGRYSRRCTYTHYTYSAPYAAVRNRAGTRIFIAFVDGQHGEAKRTPCGTWKCKTLNLINRVIWTTGTPFLSAAQSVRVLRRLLAQRGLSATHAAEWDATGPCVIELATGEEYHGSATTSTRRLPALIDDALDAFVRRERERRQAARNAEIDALIAQRGEMIFVSPDDSIAAGNCATGTDNFRRQIAEKIGATGEIGAVTVAAILGMRDDSYTRRACRVAMLRAQPINYPINQLHGY